MLSDSDKQKIAPRFFTIPVQNDTRSRTEGRPIFEDVEMVEYPIPGERLVRATFYAGEEYANGVTHIDMFPDHYERFKRGMERQATGTPLKEWPIMTTARVAELNAINIYTVDELAAVSDANLKSIGTDGRQLREQARTFIAVSKDHSHVSAQAARIAELEARIDALVNGSAMDGVKVVRDHSDVDPEEPASVSMQGATDEQLKQFIKERMGEAPRGRISREELESRVSALVAAEERGA